jgi:hypothetical protein
MGAVLNRTIATAGAPQIVSEVTAALQAAGHSEATADRAGFDAGYQGGKVIVWADLGDHAEGHFDSPGQHAARARMAGGYRQALEDAGWAVNADTDGEGMTVTGHAEDAAAMTVLEAVQLLQSVDEAKAARDAYLAARLPGWGDDDNLPPF